MHKSRHENDAEHSWHLAVMALVLAEHCAEPPSVDRALRMVVVHDLVEIYAGDTFAYDAAGNADKAERESKAADRLFALLPEEQGRELRGLWEEFDARENADSRFAACLDVLQPFLHNTLTDGGTWRIHRVAESSVRQRLDVVRTTMPGIWPWVEKNIARALARGWLSAG